MFPRVPRTPSYLHIPPPDPYVAPSDTAFNTFGAGREATRFRPSGYIINGSLVAPPTESSPIGSRVGGGLPLPREAVAAPPSSPLPSLPPFGMGIGQGYRTPFDEQQTQAMREVGRGFEQQGYRLTGFLNPNAAEIGAGYGAFNLFNPKHYAGGQLPEVIQTLRSNLIQSPVSFVPNQPQWGIRRFTTANQTFARWGDIARFLTQNNLLSNDALYRLQELLRGR